MLFHPPTSNGGTKATVRAVQVPQPLDGAEGA